MIPNKKALPQVFTSYRWRDTRDQGLEHCTLVKSDKSIVAESVVIKGNASDGAYIYKVVCGEDWVFKSLEVSASNGKFLSLSRNYNGFWDSNIGQMDFLTGITDIDLSFSPFTNTLPIMRLGLFPGQSQIIRVAYVNGETWQVSRDVQRYTRLNETLYLFEVLEDGFRREIRVDKDGIILRYPGLFERVT